MREVVSSRNKVSFSLNAAFGESTDSIESYDVWDFDIGNTKPAGSHLIIYFSDDQVSRISYQRPRIRLD